MKYLSFYIALILLSLHVACSNQKKQQTEQKKEVAQKNVVQRVSVISVKSPKAGEMFTIGDNVEVTIKLNKQEVEIDSLLVEHGDIKEMLQPDNDISYIWETTALPAGSNQIKVFAYSDGHKIDSYYLKLRFKSDIAPELYECKIVKTYPHDRNDYTQGLFYDNGILYEGTGQRGQSVLKKVDFETGKLIAELSLPANYFGEGITAYKDKIIQLTWTSNTGFVYDKESFKLLTTLQYNTQGWGITSDNEKLIMSDGTQTIHFLDPEYFNEIGKIEVYDQDGPVKNINELEYINGLVYANIWQSEEIIAFDLNTGKVVKRIDCRKIVPAEFKAEYDNVLNGIAYDHENDRYFITGKRWPNLFEVKFVKI
ncbi:MAG: glutaminyl-peptide cyclotransferase [Bacteroidetes bacterium]|nr:glutaminyl-peptide cyclotransferase [Bacteroidota bacterium]